VIAGAAGHADRALANRRKHLIGRKDRSCVRGKAKPFESGEREQRGIGAALAELLEPRPDIAAEIDHTKIGAAAFHLRRAAQRRRADNGARRKLGKRPRLGADEGIADIGARQHRRVEAFETM
jgi:hypothetical protein